MKTIGIIAEYNPFHNGHAYQIKKIREQTNADFCIVAMSGDFVQRGAPAIIDKYTRTKMALSCGADLVVELPVLWATASAEDFAMAGVSLFDKMGCVDGLCFGAETENLPLLSAIADILVQEPSAYRKALSSYIKEGLNFPQARVKAITAEFDETISGTILSEVLDLPNNILALEYLKALRRRNSSMTPYLIKRQGAGYHESAILLTDMCAVHSTTDEHKFEAKAASPCRNENPPRINASATAIRNILLREGSTPKALFHSETASLENTLSGLASTMPATALSILTEYCSRNPLLCTNDFSALLNYRLLMERSNGFDRFFDCNTDIANRLYKNRHHFLSFEQFCELNKSRDITYTRMSRILLHILLGLTKEDAALGRELDYIPYFRLLGFCRSSASVLSAIKAASKRPASETVCSGTPSGAEAFSGIPMISKLADAKKLLTAPAFHMLELDIFAAELYEQVLFHKQNPEHKKSLPTRNEFTQEIVLV